MGHISGYACSWPPGCTPLDRGLQGLQLRSPDVFSNSPPYSRYFEKIDFWAPKRLSPLAPPKGPKWPKMGHISGYACSWPPGCTALDRGLQGLQLRSPDVFFNSPPYSSYFEKIDFLAQKRLNLLGPPKGPKMAKNGSYLGLRVQLAPGVHTVG